MLQLLLLFALQLCQSVSVRLLLLQEPRLFRRQSISLCLLPRELCGLVLSRCLGCCLLLRLSLLLQLHSDAMLTLRFQPLRLLLLCSSSSCCLLRQSLCLCRRRLLLLLLLLLLLRCMIHRFMIVKRGIRFSWMRSNCA